MNVTIPRLSLVLLLVCFAPTIKAESPGPPPILPVTPIKIVAGELPPYCFSEGGVAGGVITAIVQELNRRLGFAADVTFLPWLRAIKSASTSVDKMPRLIMPLTRTPAREPQFKWVVSVVTDHARMVSLKKPTTKPIDTLAAAKALRIGVLSGSPLEAELRAANFSRLETTPDVATNARLLKAGRIDAWYVPEMVARYAYKLSGYDPAELEMGGSLSVMDLYLAASLHTPDTMIVSLRNEFAAMKADGTYERIKAAESLR